MEKVRILWSGITGRTGREALELVKNRDDVEIAAHADIKDEGQTVKITVPEKPTKHTPKTSDDRNYGTLIGLGFVALGGAIAAAILYAKKKKEDDE